MCYGCYEEYGKPAIINENTIRAARLVDNVYKFSSVGGNAHIVIDDFNIDDVHIGSCLASAIDSNLHDADKGQIQAEIRCLEFFKDMTIEERASALAIYEGWIAV